MLKLYTWTTPNGYKVPIMFEELKLEYELIPVDITKGDQKTPEFLAMNPNHKIPVLVDEDAASGAFTLAESGAILIYLAEKYGALLAKEGSVRYVTLEWLMFQMAGVGPMFGQATHFKKYAPEKIPYALKRYTDEAVRLMQVLDTRLRDAEYLGGEYSIADISTWTWVKVGIDQGFVELSAVSNVERWYKAIASRDAVTRGIAHVDKVAKGNPLVCEPTYD